MRLAVYTSIINDRQVTVDLDRIAVVETVQIVDESCTGIRIDGAMCLVRESVERVVNDWKSGNTYPYAPGTEPTPPGPEAAR